jgi:hypothetical protein
VAVASGEAMFPARTKHAGRRCISPGPAKLPTPFWSISRSDIHSEWVLWRVYHRAIGDPYCTQVRVYWSPRMHMQALAKDTMPYHHAQRASLASKPTVRSS